MIHLYVKTHNKTGMKYFGKTTRDPFNYNGSGVHWKRHIRKHGEDITTVVLASFEDVEECRMFAIKFSRENNIVKSNEWANLIEENGTDGAPIGNILPVETRAKISKTLTGKSFPKTKYTMKDTHEERSERMSKVNKGSIWANNGRINKRVREVPHGWTKGRLGCTGDKNLGRHNSGGENTRGKKIYNDGNRHAYFFEDQVPEGWKSGKMEGFQGGTGTMRKGKKYGKKEASQ
jgi:hypothetical protein